MRQFTPRELFEMRLRSRMINPGVMAIPPLIVVTAGSQNFTTPGSFTFTVPHFNTLTADVRGSGGGGGGAAQYGNNGGSGGNGSFAEFLLTGFCNLVGGGGNGGSGGVIDAGSGNPDTMAAGANGTASGGNSSNTTGGGASGGSPGEGDYFFGKTVNGPDFGAFGGNGGRAVSVFAPSQLPPFSVVTVIVPAGGGAGFNTNDSTTFATPTGGTNGEVLVSWS